MNGSDWGAGTSEGNCEHGAVICVSSLAASAVIFVGNADSKEDLEYVAFSEVPARFKPRELAKALSEELTEATKKLSWARYWHE